MSILTRWLIVPMVLFFSATGALAVLPPVGTVTQVYFFGDSLTDVGNHQITPAEKKFPEVFRDYFFHDAPVTNNQENGTPGKVWANYIAEYYGKSLTASKDGGTDYAVAGEMANKKDTDASHDMLDQVHDYFSTTNNADPQALYVILAGSNDLIQKILMDPSDLFSDKKWDKLNEVITDATNNINEAIDELYNRGARKFLIIAIPDLSLTPQASEQEGTNQHLILPWYEDQAKIHSAIVEEWNTRLLDEDPAQGPLAKALDQHSDMKIYTWDPNTLFSDVINNPEKYGFPKEIEYQGKWFNSPIKVPNNGTMWYYYHTYANTETSTKYKPEDFIFFNFVHPSTKMHRLMAQALERNAAQMYAPVKTIENKSEVVE